MLEAVANADPSADDGKHGEQHERSQHESRRFVGRAMMMFVGVVGGVSFGLCATVLTGEGKKEEAEHVEAGHERSDDAE